ncbi:hypothetical protein HG537_0C06090 [Torulaspora globosa]|uniref:Uncharacterized protein n=1 Tax=Torulaspora globosa TaxID=48254 RepID=A0A7H9HRH8_9SACH|nr:hypothetical protein HG537_0C06090 [Torulaspora sp. CBS 2947]
MARRRNEYDSRESLPLLSESITFDGDQDSLGRGSSVFPAVSRLRSNTITSIRSGYEIVREHMDKKKFAYLVLASIFLYLGFVTAFAPRTSLARDFRRMHASRLTDAEIYRIYLNALSADNLAGKHVRSYTSHEHGIGDREALEYTVAQLKELGFEPRLEKYYPWVSTPIDSKVTLLDDGEISFVASLREECLVEEDTDCDSSSQAAYHGYSANGNVTASYIFANYGRLEDYKFLLQNGIDIEGKIHIIRYGKILPGLKIKNAELYGSSGVLLYTDPYDDGVITEKNGYKPYPDGPARRESSIERAAVNFVSDFPGDPTTPGYPSRFPSTERLSPAGKIPTIPSVPISAQEVYPILRKLNGKGTKMNCTGNIEGFEYFSGPSSDNVQLQIFNKQNYSTIEITDVIVEIPGIFSEYDIIVGNHRDSWTVGGAGSPNSGSAILLEIARGMSALLKHGWKPLRPIKLISWDGGELGMLGSSEYAENHADLLKRNALVYLNLESAITGSQFRCRANPLLENVIHDAAKYTDFQGSDSWTLFNEWDKVSNLTNSPLLGFADYVPFQYHLGIPSASFEFSSNGSGDAIFHQHSRYDSRFWMEKYVDPGYKLHNTLAVMTGMTCLTLCETEPIVFKAYPYLTEISRWYEKLHGKILKLFREDHELLDLVGTVAKHLEKVSTEDAALFDAQNLELRELCTRDFAAYEFYKKIKIYIRLMRANNKLKRIDQLFLTRGGLPDRNWMKHSVYAPNKKTGYEVDVLPGLQEAIAEHDREEVFRWLSIFWTQITNLRLLLR